MSYLALFAAYKGIKVTFFALLMSKITRYCAVLVLSECACLLEKWLVCSPPALCWFSESSAFHASYPRDKYSGCVAVSVLALCFVHCCLYYLPLEKQLQKKQLPLSKWDFVLLQLRFAGSYNVRTI